MASTRLRTLGVVACLALVLGLAGWTPSASASPRQHRTTVTISLTAPDRAGLARLGRERHLDLRQRLARSTRLVPSAATRARVAARLTARGFRVLRVGSWSVTASAPDRAVADTFGAHPSRTRLRALLGSGVGGVAPEQQNLLRPMTATTGQDYRNAYAASTPVSTGHAVSTGANASNTTVATIQFAQFDASDLTRYAASAALPDPVASGQYTGVMVDVGPTSSDGATEVALDQQAILATAPTARQRAYFAPNSDVGFDHALQQVAADAAAYHITALSISWGNCETNYFSTTKTTLDNDLASLENTYGVTVFSSSGDTGVYSCSGSQTASVTFPASSPNVVGVGGTTLSTTGPSTPNTGTNWTETAWSCTSYASCVKGGSGGGTSTTFLRPGWQGGSGQRLIPDIAAVAAPTTGFVITLCGTRYQYGGTSLASPVSAALLTDALSEAGWSTGVGDIHSSLYQASNSAGVIRASILRDVTSGSNGPSSVAGTGYDTVTGVGAVLWPKFVDTYYASPTSSTSSIPAATSSATWALCSTTTPTPTSGTPTPTTATPSVPGPTALARVTSTRVRHGHAMVVARWSTVRRSSRDLAVARVEIWDLTRHRLLYRGRAYSGAKALRVRARHTVRLVVTVADVAGAGTVVRATRRIR